LNFPLLIRGTVMGLPVRADVHDDGSVETEDWFREMITERMDRGGPASIDPALAAPDVSRYDDPWTSLVCAGSLMDPSSVAIEGIDEDDFPDTPPDVIQ
jgi:hypothetical protein